MKAICFAADRQTRQQAIAKAVDNEHVNFMEPSNCVSTVQDRPQARSQASIAWDYQSRPKVGFCLTYLCTSCCLSVETGRPASHLEGCDTVPPYHAGQHHLFINHGGTQFIPAKGLDEPSTQNTYHKQHATRRVAKHDG